MQLNNVIRIKIGNSVGTGILIKLINDNSFMILTCAHCIEGATYENTKISFLFLKDVHYKILQIYKDESNDIGGIILDVDSNHDWDKTYIGDISRENIGIFKLAGYPNLLQHGDDSRKKVLDLSFRNTIDQSDTIFKLNEKLNDTASTSEKQKLEGFSGGPIYYSVGNKDYIIAIAKGVESNNGEDVIFNEIVTLDFEIILKKLNLVGKIIYNIKEDGEVEVIWNSHRKAEDYFKRNILVIGGSGAGKSSFIKSFAMHSDFIDAAGDGQTTRNDVEYQFSICNTDPKIEVKLLAKTEFIKKRIEYIEIQLISFYYLLLTNQRYDISSEIDIAIKANMKKFRMGMGGSLKEEEVEKFINAWDDINEANSSTKRNNIIELNYTLIELLKKISNLERVVGEDYLEELEQILLVCKGFFSYKEFDFLIQGEIAVSQRIKSIFEELFEKVTNDKLLEHLADYNSDKNIFYNFYGKVYDVLIKDIKNYYQCGRNSFTYSINKMTEYDKCKVAKALKVVKGDSITSMVESIKIIDSFNSDYSWIMNKLLLEQVTFIDTCGLDHVDTGEPSKEVMKKIFDRYKDNIKTIFYLKKLDSGRPTELEHIIPAIYNIQSNAAVYCILNGADILYNSHKKGSIIEFDKKDNIPNSVRYIISDQGKEDIMQALQSRTIRKGRSEILYTVISV